MRTSMDPALAKASDAARAALAKALGEREILVTMTETATVPGTREQLLRVTAISSRKPNAPQQVVVDAAGKVVDLAKLEATVGRRLFIPDIGVLPVRPAALPARVTIDPTSNDLTLPKCKREAERITVTVPKSGVKPKADVYLLSDTTGSMGPIIDAVKAGAGIIVGNPALAAFDVAFGVGNYRDFPIPPNSYAFQHQLSPTTTLGRHGGDRGLDSCRGEGLPRRAALRPPSPGGRSCNRLAPGCTAHCRLVRRLPWP